MQRNELFNTNDTKFLRVIAILLIVNSHCKLYYPISALGTGGALGNSLFFMLSSYGLLLSESRQSRGFTDWYSRRIVRLYPSIWIVVTLLLLPKRIFQGTFEISNILDFFSNYFYPPFWFINTIIIFYPIVFIVIKNYNVKKIIYLAIPTIFLYIYCYFQFVDLTKFSIESIPFALLSYFLIFLFGVYLASINKRITYEGTKDLVVFFLLIIIIYIHKILLSLGILCSTQFLHHFLLFPFLYYSLKVARSDLVKMMMDLPLISKSINYISSITLEIYMVHTVISFMFLNFGISFPINWICFIICSFLISAFVKYLSDVIFTERTLLKLTGNSLSSLPN